MESWVWILLVVFFIIFIAVIIYFFWNGSSTATNPPVNPTPGTTSTGTWLLIFGGIFFFIIIIVLVAMFAWPSTPVVVPTPVPTVVETPMVTAPTPTFVQEDHRQFHDHQPGSNITHHNYGATPPVPAYTPQVSVEESPPISTFQPRAVRQQVPVGMPPIPAGGVPINNALRNGGGIPEGATRTVNINHPDVINPRPVTTAARIPGQRMTTQEYRNGRWVTADVQTGGHTQVQTYNPPPYVGETGY